MTCANSVFPRFMHHPRVAKRESVAKMKSEIKPDTTDLKYTDVNIILHARTFGCAKAIVLGGFLQEGLAGDARGCARHFWLCLALGTSWR